MTRPLYIFDLDGTLALTYHRQHFLDNKSDPDRWRKFFEACINDSPNIPVIDTMHKLIDSGADVWIWSGRDGTVQRETLEWLQQHTGLEEEALSMRLPGDYTPDEELKQSWLQAMSAYDRRRLVAVFDDRDKVVAMWRRNRVACFQVESGAF